MAGLVPEGAFTDTLCAMVGINRQSYYKWLKAGNAIVDRCEANVQPMPTQGREFELAYFYLEMTLANVESEYGVSTKLWEAAISSDTKAIMRILERKYPHKWGRMSDRTILRNQCENCSIQVI